MEFSQKIKMIEKKTSHKEGENLTDDARKRERERDTRTLRDDLFAIKKNCDTSIQGKNRESNQRRKYGKQIGVPLTQPNWIGLC